MDSLPAPFTVEIDGHPVAKPQADTQDRTHAKTGSEPAVFELKDKRLQSNGHVLARALAENRSLMPKMVFWFKADTATPIHDVVATKDGESYKLEFSGAGLMTQDDGVFADIMGSESTCTHVHTLLLLTLLQAHPSKVVIKMQS
ncbi:hypothetical protein yc1106_04698 [Curvularia clavata]|uniref:Uncharacterized protein n=1 Tax=Curvularia clavata TaxID=95742 RepID=A0A9Q9DT58_CURCL|nr:hypothetical protein yc1106_04698 [Curvularia clavata]